MCDKEAPEDAPKVDDAAPEAEASADAGGGVDDTEYRMETAPFDPRFPNQNQTRHCTSSFVDYKRCIKIRGEDFAPCQYFRKVYKSLCPNAWIEKWEGQIESGTFPAKI